MKAFLSHFMLIFTIISNALSAHSPHVINFLKKHAERVLKTRQMLKKVYPHEKPNMLMQLSIHHTYGSNMQELQEDLSHLKADDIKQLSPDEQALVMHLDELSKKITVCAQHQETEQAKKNKKTVVVFLPYI